MNFTVRGSPGGPGGQGLIQRSWRPGVGQLVRLSRFGYTTVGGIRTPEQMEAQQNGFRVTGVSLAHTEPEVYNVKVDGPFGGLMISSCDLEPFPGAPVIEPKEEDLDDQADRDLMRILAQDGIAVVGPDRRVRRLIRVS